MAATEKGRTIERQVEVHAPVEDVWKALTDAKELTRWFPMKADVKPGVGGHVWMSWEGHFEGTCEITVWEPPNHLQYSWMEHPVPSDVAGDSAPVPLLVDFHLEGRDGYTVLRLVHSGFGSGADWDQMYDGIRRGWWFELGSMKRYLERFRGEDRDMI